MLNLNLSLHLFRGNNTKSINKAEPSEKQEASWYIDRLFLEAHKVKRNTFELERLSMWYTAYGVNIIFMQIHKSCLVSMWTFHMDQNNLVT